MTKTQKAKELCSTYFKNDKGKPFELTPTQAKIFYDILFLAHPRIALLAMTRYGKSEIVAMAILLRSLIKRESFVVAANTKDLGMIMMDKCIAHLGDHPKFEENLVLQFKNLTSKLQKKESKTEFTWIGGGGIKMITLGSTMKKSEVESAIGQGTTRLVLEECSAIPNNIVGMAMRMLGDDAEDNFCLKLGNALYRNHFYKSVNSSLYKTYILDYRLALKEGRTTQAFVDERRGDMTERQFEAMYLCKFPNPDEIDHLGYFALFKESDFKKGEPKHKGTKYLGFDPSEGRDENVGVLRSDTYAQVVHNSFVSDLMAQTKIMVDLIDKHGVEAYNCFPDDTGVGAGITDRAKEMKYPVQGIKWGMASEDKRYANLKAQNYFDLKKWVMDGGVIDDEKMIEELMTIRWKETTSKRIQIKTKKEYASEGIKSQNRADALALTFNEPDVMDGDFGAMWV